MHFSCRPRSVSRRRGGRAVLLGALLLAAGRTDGAGLRGDSVLPRNVIHGEDDQGAERKYTVAAFDVTMIGFGYQLLILNRFSVEGIASLQTALGGLFEKKGDDRGTIGGLGFGVAGGGRVRLLTNVWPRREPERRRSMPRNVEIKARVMNALGVTDEDLLEGAYLDLLAKKAEREGR